MKTALVIPAYNEEQTIKEVLKKATPFTDYTIVIDDGSKDSTWKEMQKAKEHIEGNIIALKHIVNLGKGAALKTGCAAAQKLGADIIVTIDADGQHPPEHIPAIIEYMNKNNLEVVFSIRKGGDKMPLIRLVGNKVLNLLAIYLFNLKLRDIWCGFRAFRTDCLSKLSWEKNDYSGEIEMALKVGKNKLRYGELVIPTIYHDAHRGVTILHGLKLIGQMIIWRIMLLK